MLTKPPQSKAFACIIFKSLILPVLVSIGSVFPQQTVIADPFVTLPRDWLEREAAERPPQTQFRRYLDQGLSELNEGALGREKALFRILRLIEIWESEEPIKEGGDTSTPVHSVSSFRRNMAVDFFTQAHFFEILDILDRAGHLPEDFRLRANEIATATLSPQERGPNNRSYHYALAQALAARIFPESARANEWRAYAEAVWADFAVDGDTYEPGYVDHNLPLAIQLGRILGKESELVGPHLRPTFDRFLDHVSPSGIVVDPGDGANQSAYLDWLKAYAALSRDGRYLWAAERVIEAGESGGYLGRWLDRPSADVAAQKKRSELRELYSAGLEAIVPIAESTVEYAYPMSHRIADRINLNPSNEMGAPFASFYLNDMAETLHHAHEDNRGELFQYEVDGTLLLKRSSWHKWAGQTNTFVVADARSEFPFPENFGPAQGHWYEADANIRPIRLNRSDAVWERRIEPGSRPPHDLKLYDARNGLGYRWDNPKAYSGAYDQLPLHRVAISINTFPAPESGAYGKPTSFPSSVSWYRDYRRIAPADGATVLRLSELRLTGPAGHRILAPLESMEQLELRFYPAGQPNITAAEAIVPPSRKGEFLREVFDPELGANCLEATCPPGRLDIVVADLDLDFDLTKEYPRIGFDYKFVSPTSSFLRPPITLLINDLRFRSLYIDHQQGGILAEAWAEDRGGDAFASMVYKGAWKSGSTWTRSSLLTKEGALVVLDSFVPPELEGLYEAGPVWQLPPNPHRGENWFAHVVDPFSRNGLLIWMQGPEEAAYGTQFQSKLWHLEESAVYARTRLQGGERHRFLTICLPYDSTVLPQEVAERVMEVVESEDGFELKVQLPTGPGASEVSETFISIGEQAFRVERPAPL